MASGNIYENNTDAIPTKYEPYANGKDLLRTMCAVFPANMTFSPIPKAVSTTILVMADKLFSTVARGIFLVTVMTLCWLEKQIQGFRAFMTNSGYQSTSGRSRNFGSMCLMV